MSVDAVREGVAGPKWDPPRPLPDRELPPVPPFDDDLLPDELRLWVQDISERMQVAPDIVAVAAMCGLGIVCANARTIHPKRYDTGWRVYPNLWGAAVATPGSKKSPAIKPIESMLDLLEKGERERHEKLAADMTAKTLLAKLKRDALERDVKSSLKRDAAVMTESEIADRLRADAPDPIQNCRLRHLKFTDATIEKIAELVQSGRRRSRPAMVWNDELIFLLRSFDKQGHEADRAFYMAAWGVSNHKVDRIMRGSTRVVDLAIGLFGNMTPGTLEKYVRETITGEGKDGFLQRLQLLVYPDSKADWTYVDRPPVATARYRALRVFERLFAIDDDDEDGKPPALHFSREAQEFFNCWLEDLERRLAVPENKGGWDEARQSHYSKYRSLMPALALVWHLASCEGNENQSVSLIAAQRAAQWCAYLAAHAERVYSLANDSSSVERKLIDRIESGELATKVPMSNIRRRWFQSVRSHDFEEACERLQSYGWLVLEPMPSGKPGRPPMMVTINPAARVEVLAEVAADAVAS